jgi:hypothetical protein
MAALAAGLDASLTPGSVMAHYKLDPAGMDELLADPAYADAYEAELERFRDLGPRAAFVFRNEQMAGKVGEALFTELTAEGARPDSAELRRAYEIFTRYAGLEPDPKAPPDAGRAGVSIQINVPELPSGKLAHLRNLTDGPSRD